MVALHVIPMVRNVGATETNADVISHNQTVAGESETSMRLRFNPPSC